MALPDPSGESFLLLLSHVPFNKKWDLLKPHIIRLYIDEDRPLSEVIITMKREFEFNAKSVVPDLHFEVLLCCQMLTRHDEYSESSYKYYLKKWKLKKSIPASKKAAMCDYLQTRANAGKRTAMTYKGKEVDPGKLRRVMKEDARKQIAMLAPRTGTEAGAGNISYTVFPAGNRM